MECDLGALGLVHECSCYSSAESEKHVMRLEALRSATLTTGEGTGSTPAGCTQV